MAEPRSSSRGNTIVLTLGHLLHDVYTAFLAPLLPILIQKHGLSLALAGMLDIARNAPSLLNPLAGLLADKKGTRYFVIVAPAITGLAMSCLGAAPGYAVLLILLFVTGVSAVLFHVSGPIVMIRVCGGGTGAGMSWYMFGGETARTLGPLLITGAITLWGLEGSWRVMPLGLAASVLLYFKLRNLPAVRTADRHGARTGIGGTLWRYGPFFICLGGFLLFRAGMKSALTLYLPTYLTGQGQSIWMAAGSLSVLQLAGAAGTLAAGIVSDRIGKPATLAIAAVVNPLLMWLFVYSEGWVRLLVLVILGIFLFSSGPVLLAMVQDTKSDRPSFVNGIYMTLNFGIGSLSVLVTGFLGDSLGLDATFRILGTAAVATIPFVWLLTAYGPSFRFSGTRRRY